MRKFILVLVLTTFSLFGASFDCTKAKSDVEKAICRDDELSKLDEELDSAYKEALINGTYYDQYNPDIQKIKQAQREWVKDRNTCDGDIDCLIEKYNSRLHRLIYDYTFEKPPTELSPVKYTLIMNENNAICSHLLELYNHDIEQFQKVNYDNHVEFNWLKWEAYVKPDKEEILVDSVYSLIGGAFFDINNDGKEDFIFAKYSASGGNQTEDYRIYDHNVSDFFKHSPIYGDQFPPFTLFFDDIGNRETTLANRNTMRIDGISYSLISKHFDQLPPYTVKKIQETKRLDDKYNAEDKNSTPYESAFYPTFVKNEIRFLKWNDGKIYMVFEGSDRLYNRNKFNLIGYLQEDYIFNPQCLFYKKTR